MKKEHISDALNNLLLTAKLTILILDHCSFICCSQLFVQVGTHQF